MLESLSSLQLSLAVIGGLTLVGVVAYNYWTSRKNAPRQADPHRPPVEHDIEPVLTGELPGATGHDQRWRKSLGDIASLVELQKALLSRALELVEPGGVVAYVTCSPVVEETVEVVEAVCSQRGDCELLDTSEVLNQVTHTLVDGARRGTAVQLWTYRHGCDDMFIQLIRTRASVV